MSWSSQPGLGPRKRFCSLNRRMQPRWGTSRDSSPDPGRMDDVIIAGAGVAGSALAILLGRAGYSVGLFDQAQFPREKPCGEGIMPAGVAALERMGLLEAVGGQSFAGIRYIAGRTVAQARF